MGLLWREPLPTPASAQLPVLGKRLWLLQSRGGHAYHRWMELACSQGADCFGESVLVLGKRAQGSCPHSLKLLPWFSAFSLQKRGAGKGEGALSLTPRVIRDEGPC